MGPARWHPCCPLPVDYHTSVAAIQKLNGFGTPRRDRNARSWPKANIAVRSPDVRFQGKSRHSLAGRERLLMARNGHIEIKTDRNGREAPRLNYGSPFVTVKGLNPRSARAAHEAAPRCDNRK
jgi:hypothetical protein